MKTKKPKSKPEPAPAKDKFWVVSIHVDATAKVYVKAPTREEAEEKGMDDCDDEDTELGGPQDVVDCEELSEAEWLRYRR